MGSKVFGVLIRYGKVAALAALFSCQRIDRDGNQRSDSTTSSPGRAFISQEIVAELRKHGDSAVSDSSRMQWIDAPSAVVPNLTYHWGRYHVADDASIDIIAGARGEQVTRIRGKADWWALVNEWRPRDAAEARQACLELVRVTEDGWDPRPPIYFHVDSLLDSMLFPHEVPFLKERLRQPQPSLRPSKGASPWELSEWIVRPTMRRLAVRYRCGLPSAVDQGLPELVAVDSVLRTDAQRPQRE